MIDKQRNKQLKIYYSYAKGSGTPIQIVFANSSREARIIAWKYQELEGYMSIRVRRLYNHGYYYLFGIQNYIHGNIAHAVDLPTCLKGKNNERA